MAISADELVQRNARFADGASFAGLSFPTSQTLRVVGCVDSRVDPSGPPHMVILHHTNCGIKQLAAYPEQLAEFFEIPVADLEAKMVSDPRAAVRIDVEIARRALPTGLLVSGLVYDTGTGLVEVVVPPASA